MITQFSPYKKIHFFFIISAGLYINSGSELKVNIIQIKLKFS